MDKETKDAIAKIAEDINRKRRTELFSVFRSSSEVQKYLATLKKSGAYKNGSRSKVWRKVASMPVEVDKFFSDVYGEDYYKDPDFFRKHAPEWMVFDPNQR